MGPCFPDKWYERKTKIFLTAAQLRSASLGFGALDGVGVLHGRGVWAGVVRAESLAARPGGAAGVGAHLGVGAADLGESVGASIRNAELFTAQAGGASGVGAHGRVGLEDRGEVVGARVVRAESLAALGLFARVSHARHLVGERDRGVAVRARHGVAVRLLTRGKQKKQNKNEERRRGRARYRYQRSGRTPSGFADYQCHGLGGVIRLCASEKTGLIWHLEQDHRRRVQAQPDSHFKALSTLFGQPERWLSRRRVRHILGPTVLRCVISHPFHNVARFFAVSVYLKITSSAKALLHLPRGGSCTFTDEVA